MIDMKQAVQIAKAAAIDVLNEGVDNVEEIEREVYKDRDVWSITLSVPRKFEKLNVLNMSANPLDDKMFLIDVETGDLAAVRIREVASR
jgi:hypothetical protein